MPMMDQEQHRNIADLRQAALGDQQALLNLSREARRLVLADEADEIVTSVEGIAYARLAATSGNPDALLLLVEHCSHLAQVYSDCGEPEIGDDWLGQALGTLELVSEILPVAHGELMTVGLIHAASTASPSALGFAKIYRDFWAPVFLGAQTLHHVRD